MRIAVFGSGGVGGYFGGRLTAAGVDVTFIARGAHLEAMRANGLRIISPKGDLHLRAVQATADPADVGPVDAVLFAVKLYDVESALPRLASLIGPATVVVPLQNGVDMVTLLQRAIASDHVAGGTCYLSAAVSSPGVITHTAMDHMVFGELDGARSPRLAALHAACAPAGFQATLSDDTHGAIWAKFVRLSSLSGMTAVTRSPLGVLRDDPRLWQMLRDAVGETVAVARGRGVALPGSMIDDAIGTFESLPPQTRSSMQEDLDRGRRLELPWLSGAVDRIGREVGVPTPTHSFIASVLGPHVHGRAQA